jgi:hypothetical protein
MAIAISLLARAVYADGTSTSIVVWAEGPDADRARAEVTDTFTTDLTFVDPAAWRDAFRRTGPPVVLARAVARPKTRAALLERVQRAAESVGAAEVVLLTTSRTKGGHHFADAYVVLPGQEPETLVHVPYGVGSGGLGGVLHDKIVIGLPKPTVAQAPPTPPPPPAAPVSTPPDVKAPPPQPKDHALVGLGGPPSPPDADRSSVIRGRRPRHVMGRELFALSVGGEVGMRHFDYHDPFTTNLRSYELSAAPLVVADGAVYPFADLRVPVLADVGIVGGYAQAFGLQSAASESGSITTDWYRWYVGGRFRLRTGGDRAPVLGAVGAYGSEVFRFDGSDPTGTFPSVDYTFVRASADVRVPIGRFAAVADGGYLAVLSAGDVASRFPHASVGGVAFGLGGTFTIGYGLEAGLEASYRRFFYSMNPRPGDGFVAGGALDEFWGFQGKVAYVY